MSLDALHDSECPSIYGRAIGNNGDCTCKTTAAKIAVDLENISYSLPSGTFDDVAKMIASLEGQKQEAIRWLVAADRAILGAPHATDCDSPDYGCTCWKRDYEAQGESL